MIFGERYDFFHQTHNSFKGCKIQYMFFDVFFLRSENRSLKIEVIKQTFLAAKAKEDLRKLKRSQQHRAKLQTQTSLHDSSKIMEVTPILSPISIGGDVEIPPSPAPELQEKKCNWCHIPFNCFDTRKKRLKHIRNCKKSKGQCRGEEIACFMFY